MEVNCVFAPSIETPEHMAYAESLGYSRAWCYDSPVIYADPWMTLALAADRTSTIRLGACVVTPHLRHLVSNAAATAHLCGLAPGRVDLGVGVGFTSSALLGRKSSRWAYVERYAAALRSLLAGQRIEWEGSLVGLLHGSTSGIPRELDVPIWLAAHGPKGFAAAERLGAGVVTNPAHGTNPVPIGGGVCSVTCHGTVLDEGETLDSPRVRDAAGPAAAFALHLGGQGPLAGMPEQVEHAAVVAKVPPEHAHLELHRGHLIEPNEIDAPFLTPDVIARSTLSAPAEGVWAFLSSLAENGAAAVLYQPAGSDIRRELRAFAQAAGIEALA